MPERDGMSEFFASTRGRIAYDWQLGHVCTCTETIVRDDNGMIRHADYELTVVVDRSVEPTESGSYWYVCRRCGAGGWSGL